MENNFSRWYLRSLLEIKKSFSKALFLLIMSLLSVVSYAQGPNCTDINLSIDEDGYVHFTPEEFIVNFEDRKPFVITLLDQYGVKIFNEETDDPKLPLSFSACAYLDKSLKIHVENTDGDCWSTITFKNNLLPKMTGNKINVYCDDPLIKNNKPIDGLPSVSVPCGPTPTAKIFGDWIDTYPCISGKSDTLKVIYRGFEAFDKYGHRGTTNDTIVVFNLPEITSTSIQCVEKDTLYCGTGGPVGPEFFFPKEPKGSDCTSMRFVDVEQDDDGLKFLARKFDEKCGLLVNVDYWTFDDSKCEDTYKVKIEIKQTCSAEPSSCVAPMASQFPMKELAKGYWECEFWVVDVDTIAPYIGIGKKEVIAHTMAHECVGQLKLPPIYIQDNWTGVKHAKLSIPNVGTYELTKSGEAWTTNSLIKVPFTGDTLVCKGVTKTHDFGELMLADGASKSLGNSYLDPRLQFKYENEKGGLTGRNIKGSCGHAISTSTGTDPVDISPLPASSVNTRTSIEFTYYGDGSPELAFYDHVGREVKNVGYRKSILRTPGCSATTYRFTYSHPELITTYRISSSDQSSFALGNVVYTMQQSTMPNVHVAYLEAYDNCHQLRVDSFFVRSKDFVKPVPVCDQGVIVGLTEKKVWVDADVFNEGSRDNCGIETVLARRKDWKEFCVDLCPEDIKKIKTIDSICLQNPIIAFQDYKNDGEKFVEEYYANQMKWLDVDGGRCHDFILDAWKYDIYKSWIEDCLPPDEHGNQRFKKEDLAACFPNRNLTELEQLGGGWSMAVPFGCEDACKEVKVELLVMDYWCNYAICWEVVYVEDKQPVKVVKEIANDFDIACSIYDKDLKSIVEAAAAQNNADLTDEKRIDAFQKLDDIFGSYRKVWLDKYGNPIDAEGKKITQKDCEFTLDHEKCVCKTFRKKVAEKDPHTGYITWKYVSYDSCYKEPEKLKLHDGLVAVNCASQCWQDVWVSIDECGKGRIARRFYFVGGCEVDDPHWKEKLSNHRDTTVKVQNIWVGDACDLNLGMFKLPTEEVTIASCELEKDEAGNVAGLAHPDQLGWPVYQFPEDCKKVGVGYYDKVFEDIHGGESAKWKIVRTWCFLDWCDQYEKEPNTDWWHNPKYNGRKLTWEQKIVVNHPEDCSSSAKGKLVGKIETVDGRAVKNVKITLADKDGSERHYYNDADGSYSIDLNRTQTINVSADKEDVLDNGVTTRDLVVIHRHLLGKGSIQNHMDMVAGDVDMDGKLNTKDIIWIRRAILGKSTQFPSGKMWRFMATSDEKEVIEVQPTSGTKRINFTGIKLGDVNRDNDPTRQKETTVFQYSDQSLQGGQRYDVELSAHNLAAIDGLQFAIKSMGDRATITGISSADIAISEEHFSQLDHEWRFSWTGDLNKNDIAMTLTLEVNKDSQLSDLLTLSESYYPEVYHQDLTTKHLVLAPKDELFGTNQLDLRPNPFSESVNVSFRVEKPEVYDISVYDMAGKRVYQRSHQLASGQQQITITANALGGEPGIYVLIVANQHERMTKKLILSK